MFLFVGTSVKQYDLNPVKGYVTRYCHFKIYHAPCGMAHATL